MSAQHKADDSWDKYEAVASPLMAWIAEKQAELDENAANEDIAAVKVTYCMSKHSALISRVPVGSS